MDLVEGAPGRRRFRPVQLLLAAPADRDLLPAPCEHRLGGLAAIAAAPLGQAAGSLQFRPLGAFQVGVSHETSPPVIVGVSLCLHEHQPVCPGLLVLKPSASGPASHRVNGCSQGYCPCNYRRQPLPSSASTGVAEVAGRGGSRTFGHQPVCLRLLWLTLGASAHVREVT